MRRKSIIIYSVIIIFVIAIIIWLLLKYDFTYASYKNAFNYVKNYVNSFGQYAVIAFILIFSLRTLLLIFPYSVMVFFGGSIFGPRLGFIYSMISVFISASMAYFMSKYLGKEFVQKLLRGKLKQLDSKVEEHGFKIILFMRLSTVFPYDILNFAAGLTKIRYRAFILGTLLGMFLETFSINYLGATARNPFSLKFKIAIGLIILTIAIPSIYNKLKKKTPEKAE